VKDLNDFKGANEAETKANFEKLNAFKSGTYTYLQAGMIAKVLHAGDKPKELTADEHREQAQKHLDASQQHSFAGRYEDSHKETVAAREHLAHAIGKEKDKFNAVLNNPEIEHVVISQKNPLSTQLTKLTGDSYNAHDFDGSTALGGVLTHKASGKKFTVMSESEAPIVKDYQKKNAESKDAPDFDKISKKLKGLTANNNHTEALHHLAKEVGHKESADKMEAIKKKQDKQGYLSMEDSQEKYGVYKNLMNHIKEKHGEEAHKKIHSSL
jgi:hypothetical protein